MPCLLNELIYKEVRKELGEFANYVFVQFDGCTQIDSTKIRKTAKAVGVRACVVKNSITELVLKDMGYADTSALFHGATLILMGNDPVAAAKVACQFNKESSTRDKKKGEINGAIVEGVILNTEETKSLSTLPSREVLLGQLVGVMAAPMRGLVTVLSGNIRSFACVLNAVREKKEQESAA